MIEDFSRAQILLARAGKLEREAAEADLTPGMKALKLKMAEAYRLLAGNTRH